MPAGASGRTWKILNGKIPSRPLGRNRSKRFNFIQPEGFIPIGLFLTKIEFQLIIFAHNKHFLII